MMQEPLEKTASHCDAFIPTLQEVDSVDIGLMLEQYGSYITEQVDKLVSHGSQIGCTLMLDKDDIAQLVLIKFWLALKKNRIIHPRAYIKRIAYNEFVNALRGYKPTVPLSVSEEEEEIRDRISMSVSCEAKDIPEVYVEREDAAAYCAQRAAEAISKLAPRQKKALECFLYEHLDDTRQFRDAFKACNLDIEGARWPIEIAEKRLLNASLSAARSKVAQLMDIDLTVYKQKGASYFVM